MEDKAYAVKVVGYECWFFFDYYENVEWFMELCAEDGNSSSAFKRNELGQYELISWNDGRLMKFTYYCIPGQYLAPREHFVYIGDWIRPKGCIVLQHGNLSYLEYKKISEQGFIRIFEDRGSDYSYIETIVNRPDLQRYRDKYRRRIGVLTQKSYNLYAGRVWVYGRVIK